jgi:hypothetical protein
VKFHFFEVKQNMLFTDTGIVQPSFFCERPESFQAIYMIDSVHTGSRMIHLNLSSIQLQRLIGTKPTVEKTTSFGRMLLYVLQQGFCGGILDQSLVNRGQKRKNEKNTR